ncbi:protein tyrosine kinase [Ancylostoma duodenale]|uniref:Protein tyrosine kinase n=1 Tax=Ancylostoma duodenale TaxID=51022 RepID=A0A0C2H3D9_9BILA|nr:protein tyrosine kinase [Ancylostoma duodenale]
MKLVLRFRPPIEFKDPNAFRFRIADDGEREFRGLKVPIDGYLGNNDVLQTGALQNQRNYSYTFDYPLKRLDEYKVTLFAEDDHFCHTDDIAALFNTSAVEPTPALEEVGNAFEVQPTRLYNTSVVLDRSFGVHRTAAALHHAQSAVHHLPLLSVSKTTEREEEENASLRPVDAVPLEVRAHFYPRKVAALPYHDYRHSILETNILYRQPIEFRTPQTEEEWLIPADDVSVGGVIGEGAFGLVCKGTMSGPKGMAVRVAIKQLKTNAVDEEKEEFLREMDIMKQVGRHPNIVTMYGLCEEPDFQCMVMEYVPFGDLKHYLQNLRKQLSLAVSTLKTSLRMEESVTAAMHSSLIGTDQLQYSLDPAELQSFAAQVANGMAYGIVLWEIVTLGGFPYPTVCDKDMLQYLLDGNRLEKPISCSDEM